MVAPLRVRMGQEFTVTYTVTNYGGDILNGGMWTSEFTWNHIRTKLPTMFK